MMNKEQKIELKTNLIELCKKHLLSTTENLKREMDDCQQMANEYGPPKDRYDAFRSQILRKRDMFAQQMGKANQELAILSVMKPDNLKEKVELGSIVFTNTFNYFVATSLGNMKLNNMDFMCISPAVPIFKALSGLKTGGQVSFNGNTIIITDVF